MKSEELWQMLKESLVEKFSWNYKKMKSKLNKSKKKTKTNELKWKKYFFLNTKIINRNVKGRKVGINIGKN